MPQRPDWNKFLDAGAEFVALTRGQARARAKDLVAHGQLAQVFLDRSGGPCLIYGEHDGPQYEANFRPSAVPAILIHKDRPCRRAATLSAPVRFLCGRRTWSNRPNTTRRSPIWAPKTTRARCAKPSRPSGATSSGPGRRAARERAIIARGVVAAPGQSGLARAGQISVEAVDLIGREVQSPAQVVGLQLRQQLILCDALLHQRAGAGCK